jgi:hypothetical protein
MEGGQTDGPVVRITRGPVAAGPRNRGSQSLIEAPGGDSRRAGDQSHEKGEIDGCSNFSGRLSRSSGEPEPRTPRGPTLLSVSYFEADAPECGGQADSSR